MITPNKTNQLSDKLKAILEAHKKAVATNATIVALLDNPDTTDKYGNSIAYNTKQQEFIDLVKSGKSCVLIGAAGTGKTTCIKGALQALIQSGSIPAFQNISHKHLSNGTPGVSVSAYTRRATNNIRRNMSDDLQGNALTIHKLLEFEPQYYEITDAETGKTRNTMSFEPARNYLNPLTPQLKTVVIEEASMVAVELNDLVENATPHHPQFIYLGDIQQLPPVFGSAVLGYKMLELPVVELTEVYRQALDSPIIKLAHRILSGVPIPHTEFSEWKVEDKLTITAWKRQIAPEPATLTLAKFFIAALKDQKYNPETDAILIPYNKSCGTDELNKHIANAIAKADGKIVTEIVHGFRKSYYSVGDKCLYDREDVIIKEIYPNPEYAGTLPKIPSPHLDYWGQYQESHEAKLLHTELDDVDFILSQVGSGSDGEDRVKSSSHCVRLVRLDSDSEIVIKTAGELNNLILGYALTVHKSQGSEWDKVFFCLHNSHASMVQRELLYTAVTRAKKELFIICEENSFMNGIKNQRIKGNTLAEKAEYFKGKLDKGELQS